MKNSSIDLCFRVLSPLMLDMQKSSARRRFLRHLKGFKEDYDLEGEYIRKEFSEKDEKGAPKVINDVIQFTKENRKKADAKFVELNNLVIPVDWTGEEQDRDMVVTILQDKITEFTKPMMVKDKDGVETEKPREYTDDMTAFIESLQDLVKELQPHE